MGSFTLAPDIKIAICDDLQMQNLPKYSTWLVVWNIVYFP